MGRNYKSSRETHLRRAKYKRAFTEVLDHYENTQYKSLVNIMDTAKDNGFGGTPNPARPSPLDFVCDVDNCIKTVITEKKLLKRFRDEYIMGESNLDEKEKNYFEQRIGRLFVVRSIWPVKKYFTTIRETRKKS